MFGRLQRFYTSIKVAADVVMLALAFGLAYATRFSGVVPITEGIPPWDETLVSLSMVLVIFPVTFQQARLYATNRSRTNVGELFELFKATITATLILVALTYFARERYSRLTLAIFVLYAFIFISLSRLAFRLVLSEVRRRGFNLKSILVIGAGELGHRVIETVEGHRELGFRVTGLLTLRPEKVGQWVNGVQVVGHVAEVDAVLNSRPVDQVIIAVPLEDQAQVKPLMEQLALRTVDVKVVPDLYQYITLYGGLEEFGGLPIISLQGDPMDGWSRVAKRAFDILFSLLAVLVSGPLMLMTAFAVKLTSRGPVLYRQERMGMDGRTFPILKFRTMRIDAEVQGATMACADDPRRTPIGTFLRKYSIDELPQFFNVLRGDMSLVGPRPERPVFIEEFKRQIPRYHLRHKVKAGITGWAQVNGLRGQTSIQKRIEYDLYYIENWSLLMDLKILLRTALGGFLSKNAY
ncbi:undecaprenyl-phosphate glucose phosphotransferase [Corallococcus sp. H22C18031201]|uniref:undecaprenyl-phosphate glucose phosphotransferase n=1 Tax=Citreicoccus inhibens TaxID=2849499 RepID=UPI000E727BAF|nr:undecaprenyl-phosphate glucose phosphotransferase [Citreicoccus inhibens]MBU8896894.1 undecaprenyl-phosphate glucose phosphotransferase [Citreicoccus inhibens]RJS20789.1 undecaprenyl-phosphate glucose phosphotransferase [Corallococcus sp. H22C18031201]